MIGKISHRQEVGGLLAYLYGPGGRNEHTDPHLVASWDEHPAALEPAPLASGGFDLRRLTGQLEHPMLAAGRTPERPVWHCSVRAAPTDRRLTDAEWRQVANDVVDSAGFSSPNDDRGCRWAAVRHAEEHIHLLVPRLRQDGRVASRFHDFYRVADACRAAEQRLDLTPAPRDGAAARAPTRAEQEKAARLGRAEPARVQLQREVRTAAAGAATGQEFLDRLSTSGLLVRLRRDDHGPTLIVGYSVALPADRDQNYQAIFFGGGRLAADLSWTRLARRWPDLVAPPEGGILMARPEALRPTRPTWPERAAIWQHALAAVLAATGELADRAGNWSQTGSDLAYATAALISITARVIEGRRGGPVTTAADSYDRAGHEPHGAIPVPTPTGDRLRAATRSLAGLGRSRNDETTPARALIHALTDLVQAVAHLRHAQQRPGQAAAARSTADQLNTLLPPAAPEHHDPALTAALQPPPTPHIPTHPHAPTHQRTRSR